MLATTIFTIMAMGRPLGDGRMESPFRDAFANWDQAGVLANDSGRIIAANHAFAERLGQPIQHLPGSDLTQLLEGLPAFPVTARCETSVLLRRTQTVTQRLSCIVQPLPQGNALVTISELPELAGWSYQTIVEAIEGGITIRSADGSIIASNRAARATLPPCGGDFIGRDGQPLALSQHPAMVALARGGPATGIIGARQPDGTIRWLQVQSIPIQHPVSGVAVVSSFSEIDQLIDTQRRLADSERRFRAIFDQTYEFIGLLDVEGRVIEANATALSFIGAQAHEVVGVAFADTPWWRDSGADRERLQDAIRRAAAGEFVRFETTHTGQDGKPVMVDFSLKPVRDESGRVVYLIPEGRDITSFKQSQELLTAAKLEAEAANHAKSAFLAAISHELRTPLNAVIGFSETILQEVFGPIGNARYGDYVGLIHSAGSHLRDVIEDILDVARIETGQVQLREDDMDVRDCLSGATRLMAPKAEERQIALILDAPADLPRLHADPLRIRQIVLNLLANAVKFTPPGGTVHLRAGCDQTGLWLAVADTGIGIRPEDMENIWTPFFQAEASLSRRFGGTGLGLPIVRHYVAAHGGTIGVNSQSGTGTIFTVRLPAGRVIRPANDCVTFAGVSAAGKPD